MNRIGYSIHFICTTKSPKPQVRNILKRNTDEASRILFFGTNTNRAIIIMTHTEFSIIRSFVMKFTSPKLSLFLTTWLSFHLSQLKYSPADRSLSGAYRNKAFLDDLLGKQPYFCLYLKVSLYDKTNIFFIRL
jgi:hypothetical protein